MGYDAGRRSNRFTRRHDPTPLVAARGGLAVFASGQQKCGESIVIKFVEPGERRWRTAPAMFPGCGEADGPAWVRGLQGDGGLGDFDAPAVVWTEGASADADTWELYWSVYLDAFSSDDDEGEPPATACIGRSVGTGRISALSWSHDDRPVYCSNVAYDENGKPVAPRYATEAAYARRADMSLMNRGDAAAATWIFRGDKLWDLRARRRYVAAVDDGFAIDPAV